MERFQYVRCQFDSLQRLKSPAEIRRALKQLPQGLDETYERILRNIDPNYQTQVASCLKWLALSLCALTLDELAEIFVLKPENDKAIDEDERIFSSEDTLAYLQGLVIVFKVRETRFVRLSHYSIKEYLTSNRICNSLAPAFSFTDTSAHLWIAHSSLAYVLHTGVTCTIAEMVDLFEEIFHRKSNHRGTLKWYTAKNWPRHLEMVSRKFWPTEVVKMAKCALSSRSQGLAMTLLSSPLDIRRISLQHPCYFTALSGYSQLTELLLSDDSSTGRYITQEDMNNMLQAAAEARSKELVLILLDRGAAANAESISIGHVTSGDALQAAVKERNPDIVRILVERGADINAQHGEWGSALQIAAEQDGLEMLELLVDLGADINGPSNAAGCVLSSAVFFRDDTRHLEFLLARGADINMRGTGDNAMTALNKAARMGRLGVFDLLLEKGADINIGGSQGYPLHGLAKNAGGGVDAALVRMRRLVEMGADPKARCEELGTALHVACATRNPDILRVAEFLVDHGLDVNDKGGCYGTPLQACAWRGNMELAAWLLANKADVNVQGGRYDSALQAACASGHLKMVQLLLAHGADVNAQGGLYGNALQAVCRQRGTLDDVTAIVRLLLESGASVNAAGGYFGTALQAAAKIYRDDYSLCRGKVEDVEMCVVRLLLEHGADVNIQAGRYGNALNAAVVTAAENAELLKVLLDHGADVNQVSGEFGTALHCALEIAYGARCGMLKDLTIDKIRTLVEHGADLNLAGGTYGFPLQAACVLELPSRTTMKDYVLKTYVVTATIKFLLGHEPPIDVNAHSGLFGTALQAAAYSGLVESITLLLDRGAQVACHEWCGKYGSALNAAVIKGHWDIVQLLREAGAKPDCYSMERPDEEWLLKVRREDGPGAEERYRKFWELEKPTQEQRLLPRKGIHALTAIGVSRLFVSFQLFMSFLLAYFMHLKKTD